MKTTVNFVHRTVEGRTFCDVTGTNIDDICSEMLPRIRERSQRFYKNEMWKDLTMFGKTIVDYHAGNGIFYSIELVK